MLREELLLDEVGRDGEFVGSGRRRGEFRSDFGDELLLSSLGESGGMRLLHRRRSSARSALCASGFLRDNFDIVVLLRFVHLAVIVSIHLSLFLAHGDSFFLPIDLPRFSSSRILLDQRRSAIAKHIPRHSHENLQILLGISSRSLQECDVLDRLSENRSLRQSFRGGDSIDESGGRRSLRSGREGELGSASSRGGHRGERFEMSQSGDDVSKSSDVIVDVVSITSLDGVCERGRVSKDRLRKRFATHCDPFLPSFASLMPASSAPSPSQLACTPLYPLLYPRERWESERPA